MALGSDKSWNQWIEQYALSHQHPVNLACHRVGIPLIVISLAVLPLAIFWRSTIFVSIVLFVVGWFFQSIVHVFE
ncbi:Mpo1-like protein [Aurantivibrio plasticivorans]